MRHLIIGVGFSVVMTAIAAFLGWHRSASLPVVLPPARCVSCPDWSCMTATSCGGSMSGGCLCLKKAHEQMGVCVSKAYLESVHVRSAAAPRFGESL